MPPGLYYARDEWGNKEKEKKEVKKRKKRK